MEKAREFTRQKKKSQALMCLKKKKMYEQQLERLDALVSRCAWGKLPQGSAERARRPLARSVVGADHALQRPRCSVWAGSSRRSGWLRPCC
jgi:hypothetical protein